MIVSEALKCSSPGPDSNDLNLQFLRHVYTQFYYATNYYYYYPMAYLHKNSSLPCAVYLSQQA